ncbi:hypothetical protein BJ170DRAFT_680318 [Xylariales sp. AK1849]|nr:hypothetical protein BJ170DRAFT_680318 [Xylariales sp. AK1849]
MSLGALTTTFTPPADCLATDGLYWVNTASTFYWLYGKPYQTSCFPDNYAPYQNDYYSPGVCPSGYVERCQNVLDSGTATETRATCCPATGNFVCASTSSSYHYPWGPTLGCMSVYMVDVETAFTTVQATLNGDEVAGESTSLKAPGTMMAYGIPIRRQQSDVQTTTGSQQSSVTSKETASSQTLTSASETASPNSSSTSSGGLSAGAAAGIGVGVGLAVLLVGCAAAYLFCARRKKRQQAYAPKPESQSSNDYHDGVSNNHAYQPSVSVPTYTHPSGDWAPAELPQNPERTYEVSGHPVSVEKDGSGKPWQ